jgi:hypothetical protein
VLNGRGLTTEWLQQARNPEVCDAASNSTGVESREYGPPHLGKPGEALTSAIC